VNSPASTRREYMLDVKGSTDSLLPATKRDTSGVQFLMQPQHNHDTLEPTGYRKACTRLWLSQRWRT
jgi:hypothetical protein